MTQRTGLPVGVVLLALLCAVAFGAMVHVAFAVSYHTTCVGHGFEPGGSQTDGSFFSRVDNGCSSTWRECAIYSGGSYVGSQVAADSYSVCSAWSRDFGNFTECASTAHTNNPGVFSDHVHTAPNWCG
jgi:hypothetical protein